MMQLDQARRLTLAWVQNSDFDNDSPLDAEAWSRFCLRDMETRDYLSLPKGGAHELRMEIDRRVRNHRALCSMKAAA